MLIHIHSQKDPFARVSKAILNDPDLSWKAKGLLAYFSGKPPHWHVQIQDLIKRSTDGEHAVYSAMRELREKGYAALKTVRANGRILKKEWHVKCYLDGGDLDRGKRNVENHELSKNDRNGKPLLNRKNDSDAGASQCFFGVGDVDNSFAGKASQRFFEFVTKNRLLTGKSPPNRATMWRKAVKQLSLQLEQDTARIQRVMEWYFEHSKDQYVPKCCAVTTFCNKFIQIENAMQRMEPQLRPEEIPVDNGIYRKGKVDWDAIE